MDEYVKGPVAYQGPEVLKLDLFGSKLEFIVKCNIQMGLHGLTINIKPNLPNSNYDPNILKYFIMDYLWWKLITTLLDLLFLFRAITYTTPSYALDAQTYIIALPIPENKINL